MLPAFQYLDELELALLPVAELETHALSYAAWHLGKRIVDGRYQRLLMNYCPHREYTSWGNGFGCKCCGRHMGVDPGVSVP
jgi:hypothetical protein